MDNPLKKLSQFGQAVWLDYIHRQLIESGKLRQMVTEDDLRGVTSNPSIFCQAIAGSNAYDKYMRSILEKDNKSGADAVYEKLAIQDIQEAADTLRVVYDETKGNDGFVSLEVSPHLAHDTEGTITEAHKLWELVNRPNLMVKVPATPEGVSAIQKLIAEGININATLIFSIAHYEAVARAYVEGLKLCKQPQNVSSVASFFVSRIDSAVDKALIAIGSAQALQLQGKTAIAYAKTIYRKYREIFHGQPFAELAQQGAKIQRPLWASTSTKNPQYSDVLYVEELIGPETVNTIPLATLEAFRDHGQVRQSIDQEFEQATATLEALEQLGINLADVTQKLQEEGVAAFTAAFDKLLNALTTKCKSIVQPRLSSQQCSLANYRTTIEKRLREFANNNFVQRLWAKDYSLWCSEPQTEISERMGWLTLPETMYAQAQELANFAGEIQADDFQHVVLLGMGGSSLAPEVFQRVFNNNCGYPQLIVMDSTHPQSLENVVSQIDLRKTLFLVSSKSGTTIETMSFFRYFWQRVSGSSDTPGKQFVAITDPGTPLMKLAEAYGFRRVFPAPQDVGGRYSALTFFGLLPAALIGIDVQHLLDRAQVMMYQSSENIAVEDNPGVVLGAILGELAIQGRNKITIFTSPALQAFPDWVEQLIAESTGKDQLGIVPVIEKAVQSPEYYGNDRVFVYLYLKDDGPKFDLTALEKRGDPVIHICLEEKADLAQEIFRWEMATATASSILAIHPFNQPDVQLAKKLAKQAMAADSNQALSRDDADLVSIAQTEALTKSISSWLSNHKPGNYIVLQAYIPPTSQTTSLLRRWSIALQKKTGLAVTFGYGPRFLHSTGQLHKGGPNTGLFLQLIDETSIKIDVPESDYSFNKLITAQAMGDYQALKQRQRRILCVNLQDKIDKGLETLLQIT